MARKAKQRQSWRDDGDEPPTIYQRLNKLIAHVIPAILLCAIVGLYWPEREKHRQLDVSVASLAEKRDALQAKRDVLNREYLWMRSSRSYLLLIARDRLNLRAPGEKIIRFGEDG
jgi:cell division protein FtsB